MKVIVKTTHVDDVNVKYGFCFDGDNSWDVVTNGIFVDEAIGFVDEAVYNLVNVNCSDISICFSDHNFFCILIYFVLIF